MSLRIAAEYLGYVYEEDFVIGANDDEVRWVILVHPTDDELRAIELEAMIAWKRLQARDWLTSINGRAYEHAGNSEDFDDVISDLRAGIRIMINNFAIECALVPRVAPLEAKVAFATAAPEFDLIDKAKAAKVLVVEQILALPTVEAVELFQITDAVFSAAWLAANPLVTPTLAELLIQFPVRDLEA